MGPSQLFSIKLQMLNFFLLQQYFAAHDKRPVLGGYHLRDYWYYWWGFCWSASNLCEGLSFFASTDLKGKLLRIADKSSASLATSLWFPTANLTEILRAAYLSRYHGRKRGLLPLTSYLTFLQPTIVTDKGAFKVFGVFPFIFRIKPWAVLCLKSLQADI